MEAYEKQEEMVRNFTKASRGNYEVPKTIEAVAVIIAHFLKSEEYLLGGEGLGTYTRFQENIEGYQMAVGCLTSAGLRLPYIRYNARIGVAGLRKFF